jgi:hypothetical protein
VGLLIRVWCGYLINVAGFYKKPVQKNLDTGVIFWYHITMYSKPAKTLKAIFQDPVQSNIPWADIESVFLALGGELSQGAGSRVRINLKGVRAVFHRPHPQNTTDKGALRSVRRFLENAGVTA